ncbi:MAG: hypothetical protein J6A59_15730, partial [Lachnospiraceae bacterium]|nr:hypothetical protein [Lachnospiraceae bacterium]
MSFLFYNSTVYAIIYLNFKAIIGANMYQDPTTTIEHLYSGTPVYKHELIKLLKCEDPYILELLRSRADMVRQEHYGTDVYIRGLIEFTNYCKNNCYYCGI